MADEYPDIVVSIGTAFGPKPGSVVENLATSRRGVVSHGKVLYKMAKNHVAVSLDSQMTWENYLSVLQPPVAYRSRYVRLNPRLMEDPPALDEVSRMQFIQDLTREKFHDDDRIRRVARKLIASSFYFEKSTPAEANEGHGFQCKGGYQTSQGQQRVLTNTGRPHLLPPATIQSRDH